MGYYLQSIHKQKITFTAFIYIPTTVYVCWCAREWMWDRTIRYEFNVFLIEFLWPNEMQLTGYCESIHIIYKVDKAQHTNGKPFAVCDRWQTLILVWISRARPFIIPNVTINWHHTPGCSHTFRVRIHQLLRRIRRCETTDSHFWHIAYCYYLCIRTKQKNTRCPKYDRL